MLYSMESQKILCDVCGASFNKNKNLMRHVRTVHQGMMRTDNEKRKAVLIEIAAEESTTVEDITPEESTVTEDKLSEEKPANTRFENHMKTRLKELANRYRLGDTYDSRNIKDAIVEKFNQPTQMLCFKL